MAFRRKKISTLKTVGAKLKAARKRKKFTLEKTEEATRVRIKYLQAIENDDWRKFPSRVYVLGFVRRYAEFLNLDSAKILKEFKDEFGRAYLSQKTRPRADFDGRYAITPKLVVWIVVILLTGGIISYLGVSLNRFSRPPAIDIISPQEEIVGEPVMLISGKTQSTAFIEINGQLVNVDEEGNFSQAVELSEGLNLFEVKAESRLGKIAQKTIKVIYQAEQ